MGHTVSYGGSLLCHKIWIPSNHIICHHSETNVIWQEVESPGKQPEGNTDSRSSLRLIFLLSALSSQQLQQVKTTQHSDFPCLWKPVQFWSLFLESSGRYKSLKLGASTDFLHGHVNASCLLSPHLMEYVYHESMFPLRTVSAQGKWIQGSIICANFLDAFGLVFF